MLSGRVALVTGAGSGIGREVCRVMDREGARVVAADINEVAAKETVAMLSGQHIAIMMDVSSEASVKSGVDAVSEKCGSPASLIVHCAGIVQGDAIQEMGEEAFMKIIDVNLKGTFLVNKNAANALIQAGKSGSIVNMASILGQSGGELLAHYSASKAGVEGLTRSAAKEFGSKGIRCNAVLPGFIDTPMTAVITGERRKKELETIALGRAGKPEEVAEVAAFLASDRASYITGASILCSGGHRM